MFTYLIGLALLAAPAQSGARGAAVDTTLYRVSAGTFRSTMEEGERVNYLEGGVRIDHQTTTITSERGKQYQDRDHTILIDNVEIVDGSMRMYGDRGDYFGNRNTLIMQGNVRSYDKGWEIVCDRAQYDRGSRLAVLTGNLRLSDSTRVMYADTIYYDRQAEQAEAVGHVVLIDEIEDYSIAGKHAIYDRLQKEAVVDVDPVLTFDLDASERGMVTSRIMCFDVERQIGTATHEVHMAKGETRANCDSAVIHNEAGFVELFGSPWASNGPSSMSGAIMRLWYGDEGIERVVIPEQGRLTESPREGSPWRDDSWIEGDSVVIYLSEEQVDSVRIISGSKAMYYPIEGEQGKVSNNFSSGDTMLFRFEEEELRYVRISGNSSGIYNFLNLAPNETIDSLAATIDSSLSYRRFGESAEKVDYQADEIEYFADSERIVLKGNATLRYQNKSLSAGHIDFDSHLNVLEAVGNPILEEAGQKMFGSTMGYDMDSEAGIVAEGSTQYEDGYYLGDRIFKVGEDVLKVYGSTYTTCNRKSPHYSFRANRMKVYINDKIVSGPITMYLGEVPVFYLPFMANSLRRERHSGFLRPNFDIGLNSRDGRFIRGIGYYWATNDYTDFLFTTDFNEERNFRLHLTNRYNVRYLLSGDVNIDFFRDLRNDTNEWKFTAKHRQEIGRTATLAANLSFVSSDQALSAIDQSKDVRDYVDRRIQSSVSFRKSWGGTRLSLSGSRVQKLNVSTSSENRVTMELPSFSLNFPTTSLWPLEPSPEGEKRPLEWILSGFTFAPNISGKVNYAESEEREKVTATARSGASFRRQVSALFLNFEPAMSVNWDYYDVLRDDINQDFVGEPTRATYTGGSVPTPSAAAPLVIDATNGRLQINVDGRISNELLVIPMSYTSGGALAADLESMINADASIGSADIDVTFVPDDTLTTGRFVFTSRRYGSGSRIEFIDVADNIYTAIGVVAGVPVTGTAPSGPVEDTTYKNEVLMRLSANLGTTLYGTFYPTLGPLRGIRHTFNPTVGYSYTPKLTKNQAERQSVSYSIRNAFDLKYMSDTTEVKKNNVITWNLSGSWNPQLPKGTRFSNISSSIRTGLGRFISFRVTQTYDPYKKRIISTSMNAGFSLRLNGSFAYPGSWEVQEAETIRAAEEEAVPPTDYSPTGEESGRLPWNFNVDYTVSRTSGLGRDPSTNSQLNLSGQINITTNWKVSYSSYYDIQARTFTSYQYALTRDLHCWRASFIHRQFGDDWSYYFQIQIKSHPDIMYERGPRELFGFSQF